MKSVADPRHQKRRDALKVLFTHSYRNEKTRNITAGKILTHLEEIDKKIKEAAPAWPVEKINRIDHAILRLSIYELMYESTPPKVVIDEAVELSKEYGSENTPAFINGVLGTLYNTK